MVTKKHLEQTFQITPVELLTNAPGVWSEIIESIKRGIRAGDNIPPCIVIPIEKLKGRIPQDIFDELSSAKYILDTGSGNHRASAWYDSGILVKAEIADLSTIQEFVYSISNGANNCFRHVYELPRLKQKGALENGLNAGKFYRTN